MCLIALMISDGLEAMMHQTDDLDDVMRFLGLVALCGFLWAGWALWTG